MSLSTTINYNVSGDFTFDSSKVEFTGSLAQLKLQQAALSFNETFDSDTGFTYDSSKAEFTGGLVQQLDTRPTNSIFGATYSTDEDLSWANFATLTAILNGTPTVSGGKLVCTGSQGVSYDQMNLSNNGVGTVKFKYTPNYSGGPPC